MVLDVGQASHARSALARLARVMAAEPAGEALGRCLPPSLVEARLVGLRPADVDLRGVDPLGCGHVGLERFLVLAPRPTHLGLAVVVAGIMRPPGHPSIGFS